jgi:peptide/nickel transport system permease protein
MSRYLIRRVLQLIPLLILITIVSFSVMQLSPGGPLSAYEHSPSMTARQLAVIKHDLGLDQPPYIQYLRWVSGILHGQWGYSLQSGAAVSTLVKDRLGNTLELVACAFVFAFIIALVLGVLASVKQYSIFDYVATFFSFVAYSTPVFWLGLMAQLLFAVKLHWLPTAGMYTEGVPWTFGDFLRHLLMPGLVLSLGLVAGWSRYLRASMLDVLHMDYVRTARAKGLPTRVVVLKHALRNALVPFVTVLALDVPLLFTGALLVEIVFSWPGEGRLFFDALSARDYPILMGVLLISAILILLGNLLADLMYAWLNPRVQYE